MRKLRIGVYDRTLEWSHQAKTDIENYAKDSGRNVEVLSFENAEEIVGGGKTKSLHILVVNIEEDGNSEIELVKQMNHDWPFCQIVYVSDSFRHVMEVYETRHIYYILKDRFQEKLPCIIDKAIRQMREIHHKEMIFQCHGGVNIRLKQNEIMYFERNIRVTYIVTRSGRYVIDEKIGELEQRILSDDFMRCHTSFLVNFLYVKECMKKRLVLEDGQIIDISRSYWGKVEKAYIQWAKKNIMLVTNSKTKINHKG